MLRCIMLRNMLRNILATNQSAHRVKKTEDRQNFELNFELGKALTPT